MSLIRRRLAVTLIAIAIAATMTTGALAYWSGSGSGNATLVLDNVQSLTFEAGTASAQLYPGGTANVSTVANNPNPASVDVGSLILDSSSGGSFEVDAGHSGCDVSVLSFAAQDNGGDGWQVPPRVGATDGRLAIEMPAALEMSAAAANKCQGATFTVLLKAGPR